MRLGAAKTARESVRSPDDPATICRALFHRAGRVRPLVFVVGVNASRRFKFNKRSQLLIRVHNETLSVAANVRLHPVNSVQTVSATPRMMRRLPVRRMFPFR